VLATRFGEIIGLYLTEDLSAGQEVLVDYGYMEKFLATEVQRLVLQRQKPHMECCPRRGSR
jgi:hypothetical protein